MKHAELIERLEALTGPDREADIHIALALLDARKEANWHMWQASRPRGSVEMTPEDYWRSRGGGACPAYTASLDAAVALVERLGLQWLRKSLDTMTVYRQFTPEQDVRKYWPEHHEAAGATPAIALLIALLRALSSQSQEPSSGS